MGVTQGNRAVARDHRETAAGDPIFRAEQAGLRLGIYGRLVACLIFVVWYTGGGLGDAPWTGVVAVAGFACLSLAHLWLMRRGAERPWHRYVLVTADAVALAWIAANAPLYHEGEVPQILVFRAYGVAYAFFFLAASTLSLSPGLVLYTGVSLVAALWAAFLSIVAGMERTVSWGDLQPDYTAAEYIALLSDPDFIGTGNRIEESLFLLASAGVLALAARRARRLVRAEAAAQRARANLARYVSPDMVETLAAQSEPFGPVRRQCATVLFVDLVGFTSMAEVEPPEAVIAHLRDFHARAAAVIFAHGGTIEDFIGDEVVAVFGTPAERTNDPARAIACAEDLRADIAAWNGARAAADMAPVRVGIGVHTGEVVVGTTGTEARLKFTVIGDTVNVASRLQAATRTLGCEALYSAATLDAAGLANGFPPSVEIEVRGHRATIRASPIPRKA